MAPAQESASLSGRPRLLYMSARDDLHAACICHYTSKDDVFHQAYRDTEILEEFQ